MLLKRYRRDVRNPKNMELVIENVNRQVDKKNVMSIVFPGRRGFFCEHMADNGRVVIIGAISGYNATEAAKGLFIYYQSDGEADWKFSWNRHL